jgi:hypothetical protein
VAVNDTHHADGSVENLEVDGIRKAAEQRAAESSNDNGKYLGALADLLERLIDCQ